MISEVSTNSTSLSFPLESNQHYSEDVQEKIIRYLSQLNDTEKKAYMIAKGHLGTSFNITRSTGYRAWLQKE
jgi:hypothetical protein